jgi:cytochrome c oxidase subunit 2
MMQLIYINIIYLVMKLNNLKTNLKMFGAMVAAMLTNNVSLMDAAKNWDMDFQDPASPVMEGIISFHNDLMVLMTLVMAFVTYFLYVTVYHFINKPKDASNSVQHGTVIEIIWTVTPAVILLIVAVPSFSLLYAIDELTIPELTLKVLGHQWYWSYETNVMLYNAESEIPTLYSMEIDCYPVPDDELVRGELAKLETGTRLALPTETHIRVLISSTDVLHSWAVPSLGVKLDACPGRLNQVALYIKRAGVFFGQCSEICGVNHGFMPIVIEASSWVDWATWIVSYSTEK